MDPSPTKLLKSCLYVLLTPITNIVNLSLESGSSPDVLKVSHITPSLGWHHVQCANPHFDDFEILGVFESSHHKLYLTKEPNV